VPFHVEGMTHFLFEHYAALWPWPFHFTTDLRVAWLQANREVGGQTGCNPSYGILQGRLHRKLLH